MQLRFPQSQIADLAGRFSYPGGDIVPTEIGRRSRALGYFKRDDFIALCKWNGKRSSRHYERNSETAIRDATLRALGTELPEQERVNKLMELHGVSWGIASTLLHFAHPDPYPILHGRALHSLGCERKPNYVTFPFWWNFVRACREIASKHEISMRTLDRALWQFSIENPVEET